jgi:DNA-binding response OmpR family regulator/HPt (histidine-containing phosphotransfer) domain-containing protein
MTQVDKAFDEAFQAIRERYITRLAEAVADLRKFAVLCEFGEASIETGAAISRIAHKLAGSGTTLGFPDISAAAASLEQLMETEGAPGEAAAKIARALVRACEAAIGRDAAPSPGAPDLPPIIEEWPEQSKPENHRFITLLGDPALDRLFADVFAKRATVASCRTRGELLDALGAGPADLLFVDLDCSECPPDALVAIHDDAHASKVPVLALASQRRSAAVMHAVSGGRIECLLKPVEPAVLYEKAFRLLEGHRLIVVLCDDDRIVGEFLKPRFEASGFEVHLAKDGEEMIELARRLRPSIIVLDRSMPRLEGLVVLRMLKAEAATHDIPVLMLTSRAQPHEITECLKSGATAYMPKPFAPKAVVAKCLEILGAPNAAGSV